MTDNSNSRRDREIYALMFALAFPSLVTAAYFVWLADWSKWVQQLAYGTGKSIQFAFPVVWWWYAGSRLPELVSGATRFRTRSIWWGLSFGAAVVLAMAALYAHVLKPSPAFTSAAHEIRQKVTGFGITGPGGYMSLAVFYALLHSFFEEYYWRWFVFGRMACLMRLVPAMATSSLGFMAHHVIVLGLYFGWSSPWTYLLSFAVAVGGAVWAWLYARGGSLLSPWLSHLLVDAGIFAVGWDLVRGQLG